MAWESLEKWARLEIQDWVQELMVAEVTELLGREKSERRKPVDTTAGYRNGYGKPRKLTMSVGTVTVRRPRVRDVEERFESRVLPLFKRRSETVSELIPELYLHGLAHGDFDLALRGLLGEDAPLSPSTVSRLKQKWQGEYEQWLARPLDELELVYLWVDGVYVKAGLEKDKAAVLVAVGGLSDGTKIVLTLEAGHRESEASWSSLLRRLKKRGLRCSRLVIGDGHLGIWAATRNVFPEAEEQRRWNHRILNGLDRIPKRDQAQAKPLLTAIPSCPKTRTERQGRILEAFSKLAETSRRGTGSAIGDPEQTSPADHPFRPTGAPELLCGGAVVIAEQAAQSLTTSHLPVRNADAFFRFEQRVPELCLLFIHPRDGDHGYTQPERALGGRAVSSRTLQPLGPHRFMTGVDSTSLATSWSVSRYERKTKEERHPFEAC